MKYTIKNFVNELSEEKSGDSFINHYSLDYNPVTASACQINLLCYLTTVQKIIKPKTLILGEAPGYKGCTLTGVPFTSEAIIGSGKIKLFNYTAGTKELIKTNKTKLQSESTSTMVWDTFNKLDIYPLLWNAFPFSPFKKNSQTPNRTPSINEIELLGKKYFLKLIKIIPVNNFVAVGKVASKAFEIFGINSYQSISHPSYGHKKDFVTGLKKLKSDKYF